MLKRFTAVFLLLIALCLSACIGTPSEPNIPTDRVTDKESASPTIGNSEDAGQEYIDSFIFMGESTTYHLKSRGVLKGGSDTRQVWAPRSGTMMLNSGTYGARIIYPDSGEEMDVALAASLEKPEYMLLTFGLNGAVANISRGEKYFQSCYKRLIETLQAASPDTVILLGACFPIAKSMDMSSFSVDAPTLNSYIDTINGWTLALASQLGLGYLNNAEAIKGSDGFLLPEYDVGDGYHLTASAYIEILNYMRTHAYER